MEPKMFIMMAALGISALAAFVVYRWSQRNRVYRVEERVKNYLCVRYGALPNNLRVDCSDDHLWPVLVAFDTPKTGIRRRLQFTSGETQSTFGLLSEKEEGARSEH